MILIFIPLQGERGDRKAVGEGQFADGAFATLEVYSTGDFDVALPYG
jgi:hypothetical protein